MLNKLLSMGNQSISMTRGGAPPEKMTHYVLGTPLAPELKHPIRKVVFATGCYWGAEKSFWRMPGVYSTAVGNSGGNIEQPSYEAVCTGTTGHAESVVVFYDSTRIAFSDLLRQFLQCHDPTQGNRQGNDRGTQYRSAIYVDGEIELKLAQAAMKQYENLLGRKVTTELLSPAPPFYYAEDYMQQYLARPGNRQYCSAEPTGVQLDNFEQWAPKDIPDEYKPKLPEEYWKKYGPVEGCVLHEPNPQIEWPPKKL